MKGLVESKLAWRLAPETQSLYFLTEQGLTSLSITNVTRLSPTLEIINLLSFVIHCFCVESREL